MPAKSWVAMALGPPAPLLRQRKAREGAEERAASLGLVLGEAHGAVDGGPIAHRHGRGGK